LRHAGGKIRVAAIVDTLPDGPRLHMPISKEVIAPWGKPNPYDDILLPGKPVQRKRVGHGGRIFRRRRHSHQTYMGRRSCGTLNAWRPAYDGRVVDVLMYGPSARQKEVPADICPIGSENIPEGRFGSYEVLFGLNIAATRPVRRDGALVIEPKFISRVERGALNIKPLPPIKAPTFDWDAEFKQHTIDQENLSGQKGPPQ
jgi:hypothetical protein